MENEKIERIKNPKLSAGRIPDLLKASIMESQKKLTLVQKKDEKHYYYIPDDNILHQDHSTNPVDNQYRNQLYQNNQSEDVVLELVPVRDSSTSPAPKMLI
jgi:hypothetical protein